MNCNISPKNKKKILNNIIAEAGVNHNGLETLVLKLLCFLKL